MCDKKPGKFQRFRGYSITTQLCDDGKIIQELQEEFNEMARTMGLWIMDTRDHGVRAVLLQLGWMPPQDPETGTGRLRYEITNKETGEPVDAIDAVITQEGTIGWWDEGQGWAEQDPEGYTIRVVEIPAVEHEP